MTRHSRSTEKNDTMGDAVAFAFYLTTPQQRIMVSDDWSNGRQKVYKDYAVLLKADPIALLLASLLDTEHELICNKRGVPRYTKYEKLADLIMESMPVTVDNCPKTVDNSLKPVDNFLEKSGSPVDKLGDKSDNLSTYPQGKVKDRISSTSERNFPQVINSQCG